MGKRKPVKPGQLRRVGGVAMFSMSVGMIFALLFPGFSMFLLVCLLVVGFYLLFM